MAKYVSTQQRAALTTLPTELIEGIATYLSIHDLGSFRQSSQTVCEACDALLTRALRTLDGIPPTPRLLPANPDPYDPSGLDFIDSLDGTQEPSDVWLPPLKGEQIAESWKLDPSRHDVPSTYFFGTTNGIRVAPAHRETLYFWEDVVELGSESGRPWWCKLVRAYARLAGTPPRKLGEEHGAVAGLFSNESLASPVGVAHYDEDVAQTVASPQSRECAEHEEKIASSHRGLFFDLEDASAPGWSAALQGLLVAIE